MDEDKNWLFDINNPGLLYTKIKESGAPLENYLEELFLIGKLEETLKAEIDLIIQEIADKSVLKAFRGRNKISNTGTTKDYNKQLKTMISFAKKTEHLNIGKLYCLLRTGHPDQGDLPVIERFDSDVKNPLAKEPQVLARFNGVKELTVLSAYVEGLPAEVGALKSLESLQISQSRLTFLPETIGQLSNLKSLELRMESLQEIPECILQLENLESLKIEGGHYDYSNTAFKIPSWIGQLKSLKKLRLSYIQEELLPDNLFPESLEDVYFAQMKNLTKIPSLKQCKNLKKFKLATSNCIEELPEELASIKSLEEVEIINMHGLKKLDGNLVYAPQLKHIKLDGVEAEISEPNRSVKAFKNLNVRNLSYFNYLLSNPDLFPELEELNLFNIFGLQDNKNGLGSFKKLRKLKLSKVGINGPFMKNLGLCKDLEKIELFFWKGDQVPDLKLCDRLKYIRLHGCEHLSLPFEHLPKQVDELIIHMIKEIDFEASEGKNITSIKSYRVELINQEQINKHQFGQNEIHELNS